MFGKVDIVSVAGDQISISNTTDILIDVNFINASVNKKFSNNELLIFSNGVSNSTLAFVTYDNVVNTFSNNQNVIIIQVPDSNNSFVVGRNVYMPNANSFTASGNLVAKNSNNSSNLTVLYITNATGTFVSSNTISGHISSNTSNTTTVTTTLSHAVEAFSYGNVKSTAISSITIPVSNTLGTSLSGTISVTNNSINVIGTSTSFTSNFANNDYIQIISGATTQVKQIQNVTNSTFLTLKEYSTFSNSVSTYKKSSIFVPNTQVKMPNASSNVASGNVYSIQSNSTFFTVYVNEVYGSFSSSNTVEGFINSSTTNTYSLTTAINTLVSSNNANKIPTNPMSATIVTGVSSNTSANLSYLTVRIEK